MMREHKVSLLLYLPALNFQKVSEHYTFLVIRAVYPSEYSAAP